MYRRFGYSDSKEAALRDYGICMRLSRFLLVARTHVQAMCSDTNGHLLVGCRGHMHRGAWNIEQAHGLRKTKHRGAVRAVARRTFEAGDRTSCCAPTRMRRRSLQELCAGESLDGALARSLLSGRDRLLRRRRFGGTWIADSSAMAGWAWTASAVTLWLARPPSSAALKVSRGVFIFVRHAARMHMFTS